MKNSEATEQLIPPAKPLRLADRLRLDSCFSALVQERRILVLHSAHASVLEHHAGLLIERLQSHGSAAIEHFSSVNSEALLSRMNEVLADLSVDQATRPSAPPSLQLIWVVLDAHTLPVNDTQLLIQLLKNFPGAGLNAILVYQGKTLPQYLVDAQGPRLVSWAIEAEPADLGETPVVSAARQLAVAAVASVGSAATPLASASASASSKPASSKSASASIQPCVASRQNKIMAAGLVLTLAVSAGGAVLTQPEAAAQLWTRIQTSSSEFLTELAQATEQVLGAAPTQVPAEPAATLPSVAATEVTLEVTTAAAPPTETQAAATQAAPSVAAEPAAVDASEPRTPPAPSTTPTPSTPPKPQALKTPLPPIAQRDLQWLLKTPDDFYLVGHGVYEDFALAQQSVRNTSYLANARLVPVLVGATQRHEYLVVTGPFKAQARVQTYVTRLGLDQTAKTVTVADLKNYIALRKAAQDSPSAARRP